MEDTKNKWIKVLMPIVAVLVILEAVVLVSGMVTKKTGDQGKENLKVETARMEAKMSLVSNKAVVGVDEDGEVEVWWEDLGGHQVDGMQLYITYDPEYFDVSDLTAGEKWGEPKLMTVSSKKSMVAVMYLVEGEEGLQIEKDEKMSALKFRFVAKKSGTSSFEVRTGKDGDDLVTRVVETRTSRTIPFSADKLIIEVK